MNKPPTFSPARQRQRRLVVALLLLTGGLIVLGLLAGSEGFGLQFAGAEEQALLIVGQIRAPRTVGAWLVGGLLGLAGAIAQGLFRNPLADPYLLGSAAGASFAVVLVLSAGALVGQGISLATALWLQQLGLVAAAFVGAVVGVGLTLVLARGAQQTLQLLLAGVVVGVMMGAASEWLALLSPEVLRGKQLFLLGSTGFLSWQSVGWLGAGLGITLPLAARLGRVLDALTLGEDSAASLGLDLARWRVWLVLLFAAATGLAVSQAGLVAFVGLVAPHVVRRVAPGPHGYLLMASTLAGGVLLLGADVLARWVMAPQEMPVGVITALAGGGYLLWLLRRRSLT